MSSAWLSTLLLLTFGWFTAVVMVKLLNGEISLSGLVQQEIDGPTPPDRMQAFVLTIVGALMYLFIGLETRGHSEVTSLPEVPEFLLAGFVGSQTLYLLGKAFREMR